ncbi:lytic transglycosylase domain-containing protein [Patulibacter minatonensis]|uniref:lytic transglycosylase domain-containing protein n=1 Tax=Patulibacter minatonensis TaxID=298163 RepID=UPI0004B60242|nr:lytic transglycosylase domain-containing protein [Patulibacter minatonensis]
MSIAEVAGRMAELQTMLAQASGRLPLTDRAAGTAATGTTWEGGTTDVPSTFAATLGLAQGGTGAPGGGTTAAGYAASASGPVAGATFPAPVGVPATGDAGGQYAPLIQAAAQRHGIDPQVFTNLVRQESGFDPSAGSSAGARGLCQLMPGTAATLGVTDITDPAQSLEGGAKYLREQLDRFGGDYTKALAAYNAGPGAVQRYGGVPPYAETQHYVATILGRSA